MLRRFLPPARDLNGVLANLPARSGSSASSARRCDASAIMRSIMPDLYFINTPSTQMERHLALLRGLKGEQTCAISLDFHNTSGTLTQLTVCAYDDAQPGLLAKVCGVLAAHRGVDCASTCARRVRPHRPWRPPRHRRRPPVQPLRSTAGSTRRRRLQPQPSAFGQTRASLNSTKGSGQPRPQEQSVNESHSAATTASRSARIAWRAPFGAAPVARPDVPGEEAQRAGVPVQAHARRLLVGRAGVHHVPVPVPAGGRAELARRTGVRR